MSRHILVLLGILLISACADHRSQDANRHGSSAKPINEANDAKYSGGPAQDRNGSDDVNANGSRNGNAARTGGVHDPGMENGKMDEVKTENRPDEISKASDRMDRTGRTEPTLTAGDQSESESDRRITQMIRQEVVADTGLSMKAKNCTIITQSGVVTLRGSVDTAVERRSLGSKAERISGVRRVDNQVEVMR